MPDDFQELFVIKFITRELSYSLHVIFTPEIMIEYTCNHFHTPGSVVNDRNSVEFVQLTYDCIGSKFRF